MKYDDPLRDFSYYHTEEMTPRHFGLILLAVILSFVIHFILFKSVGDMRFSVSAPVEQEKEEREYPTLRVDTQVEDPQRELETPIAEIHADAATMNSKELMKELERHPDLALTIPPVPETIAAGRQVSLLPAPEMKLDVGWQPRQKVVAVVNRLVRDEVAAIPRRALPAIESVETAPDYILPSDFTKNRHGADILPIRPAAPAKQEVDKITPIVLPPPAKEVVKTIAPTNQLPEETIARFTEKPKEISNFKPLDDRLVARVMTYRGNDASGRLYFRLQVTSRDDRQLPVVPKDIVFVQDASRSLAEQRLHFCRKALRDAIRTVPATDRFNVVLFRDKSAFCFPGWAAVNEANLAKADAFIDTMKSQGDTDLFESLKSLLSLPRDSKRPLIVVLVTDGKATKGLTVSSDIIGQFSQLNDNVSLFAIGTQPSANRYLLDLLTFCNRGASWISRDRWAIPETIEAAVRDCSRPVLARIGVATDITSQAEIFPLPSGNLYAGRVLEYYGSCPEDVKKILFHIRGEGGEAKCDVILQMDVDKATRGGSTIKDEWAKRKMHTLVGEYARKPTRELLSEMEKLSRETGVPIPYRRSFAR